MRAIRGALFVSPSGEKNASWLPSSPKPTRMMVKVSSPTLKTCGLTSRLVKRIASRQGCGPPSAQGDPLFGVSLISMRKVKAEVAGSAPVKVAPSVRSTDVSEVPGKIGLLKWKD